MIENNVINRIFNITESFQLPDKLMSVLFDADKRDAVFSEFLEHESDLSYDWFTNYFQEQHSNRERMMQDFTPVALADLLPAMSDWFDSVADICAGTGGLSIACWNKNKDTEFYCEELSERAIPLLLFNLSIRNITAYVVRKNILTGEVYDVYKLTKSDRFSKIETLPDCPEISNIDLCVMNPPYSVKYKFDKSDARFEEYGCPPSNFADFAFVLHGLSMLRDGGRLCAILPHGVLFRGSSEKAIRKKLIEKKNLKAVIGLPGKLFLNTDIPTCVMVLDKSECNKTVFIDASKDFKVGRSHNILTQENVDDILTTFKQFTDVERYAHVTDLKEFEDNDYNLNIPRYVDTFVPEPEINGVEVLKEIANLDSQICDSEAKLLSCMNELVGVTPEAQSDLDHMLKVMKEMIDQ